MQNNIQSKPFVIPIFIPHAGCPHRCVFCDQTSTTGLPEALPTEDQLHEGINRFLGFRRDPGRFTEISFYGGNFLGMAPDTIHSLLALADQYVRHKDVQGLRFSTRPDTIDKERMALISRFSVTTVELGVQSMDDDLLRITRRGHNVQQIYHAVDQLRQHPYRLGLQMMVGLPGEEDASALATAEKIAAMAPDFVRIYPTLILKGSPLARWYRQGRFAPLTIDQAVMRIKALYLLFHGHGISVARMGLQPTQDLTDGEGVLAGPFHPAFGELVHAAIWRDVLQRAFDGFDTSGQTPMIQLHPKLLSRVKGNKNSNVDYLLNEYGLSGIDFSTSVSHPLDAIVINGKTWAFTASEI